MPLFEVERSPRGRIRVFLRAQLPFTLAVVYIAIMVLIAHPVVLSSWAMLGGFAVTAVATVAAVVIPWEKFPSWWLTSIAGLDILAVALLRAELLPVLPSITVLAVFPILWLAYGFSWYGMVLAVFGAGFITSFRFAYVSAWPDTALEWANVITLPTFMVGVAVIVFIAARHLRSNGRRLADAHLTQAAALRVAQDTEILALSILNTVNAAVAFYDKDGRLDVANDHARQMTELVGFHLDRPPYAGDNVLAADRKSTIPYEDQIIPRALRGDMFEDHVEWLGPPDAQMAIIASTRRVLREDGELLGTVIVAYDVTELADAIDVREQFLRTVSHELRTPITSITGFLELIEDAVDPADTEIRRYIEIVTRKTNDLLDRVSDLLAANDAVKTLDTADLDVAALSRHAAAQVGELAASRGVRIEVRGPDALALHGDGAHLTAAIIELLTNAVKFGAPSATVALEYGAVGDRVRIAVTNVGHGLTHAEERRIFDRFYRAPYARAEAIQGFGLGLTNVRAIAVAHGGHTRVESTPGAQTTFTLDLPRDGAERAHATEP
ncbi:MULTISPECIES: sensor histidine kinase [unclassified Microbacterium]|uniref:sensor histidine kinase n=1 Tax=unclassified Microbacterium TaxID=2609290 RepID=UPI003865E582